MSPVYITPVKKTPANCPLCGFYQALKIGEKYLCMGNDDACKFYGTVDDAEKLKQENEECRKSTALNAVS